MTVMHRLNEPRRGDAIRSLHDRCGDAIRYLHDRCGDVFCERWNGDRTSRCVHLPLTPVALSDSQKHHTDRHSCHSIRPLCARYYTNVCFVIVPPPQNIETHPTASRARTQPSITNQPTYHTRFKRRRTDSQRASHVILRQRPTRYHTIPPMPPRVRYMAMCEMIDGLCSSTPRSLVAAH